MRIMKLKHRNIYIYISRKDCKFKRERKVHTSVRIAGKAHRLRDITSSRSIRNAFTRRKEVSQKEKFSVGCVNTRRTTMKSLKFLCQKEIHFCSLLSYKLGPQGAIKSHLRKSCKVTRRPLICTLIDHRSIAMKIQYRTGWIDSSSSLCTSNIILATDQLNAQILVL